MKCLFPFDVLVSMVILVTLSQYTYEWTGSSLPVLGSVIHAVIRLMFCITSLVSWNVYSPIRWFAILSNKDYLTEISVCLPAGIMFTFAGLWLWSWLYVLGIFFLAWTVSQVIELTWVLAYRYTHNDI